MNTPASTLLVEGLEACATAVAEGAVTSTQLCAAALDRISLLDGRHHAVVATLDDALERADRWDRQPGGGAPLAGVPIALKDDLQIAGRRRGYGTRAVVARATVNSAVVDRAIAAGAVPLVTTAVPEFDQWAFTESEAGGITRNPWDPTRTPGGSSGGAAAAVAAGYVPAAIGSDGGGSVRIPAACCGLVGYKPTRGVFPTAPAPEIWRGLGTFGTLTRSVGDATLLADALASDTPDTSGIGVEFGRPDFAAVVGGGRRTRPATVAVSTRSSSPGTTVHPDVAATVLMIAGRIESLDHRVVLDDRHWPDPTPVLSLCALAGLAEVAADADPARLEPATRAARRLGRLQQPKHDAPIRRRIAAVGSVANSVFDHADFLVTPTIGTMPPPAGRVVGRGLVRNVWASRWAIPFTALWNVAGNPAVTLPVASSSSPLPFAVQIVAPLGHDAELLEFAAQVETAIRWHRRLPPGCALPTPES